VSIDEVVRVVCSVVEEGDKWTDDAHKIHSYIVVTEMFRPRRVAEVYILFLIFRL
jgi:hypothetical protein